MLHQHRIIPGYEGGTYAPHNVMQLTIAEHAEAHRERWLYLHHDYDRIAWLALSGQINKEEVIWLTLSAAGRTQRGIPKTAEHRAKLKQPKSPAHREKLALSHLGMKASAETKLKMSRSHLNPSDEIRAKFSAAGRGKPKSHEHRAKIAAAHLGKRHSPETRAKISAALRKRSAC